MQPHEPNFTGIDAWRSAKKDYLDGRGVRIISGADVLQIKSVGAADAITIRNTVKKSVAGLEPNEFTNTAKDTRVTNPTSRRLDILFEEGALPDVNSSTKTLLTNESQNAGNSLIEIRWWRFSNGRKIPIPIP
jgi:hypothetical protein